MAALPQLRHWIAVPVIAAALIVAAGMALRFIPALTSADMSVDAELSHDHTAPATAAALFINVVFSPAGGVLMIAALCLYLLLVRRSPVNAVAAGLVAAGGWVSGGVHYPIDVTASFLTAATGAAFLTGLWNRFGLALLARIPFLAKLGPVSAPRA